ncbi:Prefoldin subunit-domain-containing protein [Calycina marina]|uniref:Prefoldin subunit-domain-containing protein n=1 Tax=Calycina marina TaxID=1763456 RepID=A0A9P7YU41_9HELO|nr:Prefoldin subunit-domain-containing protein [Calycina marina]
MADIVKDSFLDLERHRALLEANLKNLRKTLKHWHTWQIDYEGLKEELLEVESAPDRSQLVAVARGYQGELVKEKEVKELLGSDTRTTAQVVNLLGRRIDYVEQNISTANKQIGAVENRLAAMTVISTPDVRNEEGLPMTEIIEELDEEGNVIASRTITPGDAEPQLLEVLQKAGITKLSDDKPHTISTVPPPTNGHVTEDAGPKTGEKASPTKEAKKSVRFAASTEAPEFSSQKSEMAKKLEDMMETAKQAEENAGPVIIPTNESPEDAVLRREMLQYGMSEVGSVVAELDLEDGSEWSGDEDEDDDSSDYEDQYGRSIGRVVDDELRKKMMELEQRLGVQMLQNVGKNSEPEIVQEGIGKIAIQKDVDKAAVAHQKPSGKQSPQSNYSTKKSVRFSEELDISAAPSNSVPASIATQQLKPAPVGDVVERTLVAEPSKPIQGPPKRASCFKTAQATSSSKTMNGPLKTSQSFLPLMPLKPSKPKTFSQPILTPPEPEKPRTVPTGPEGKILASEVVEREVPAGASVAEPDDLDPQLLHQEVATEYNRIRNRMIQKQGGFMKEDESEIVPLSEEEGGPKRMSRFKAARLARC